MRIVVWSNFDVDFPIQVPDRWMRFNMYGHKGLIRVKNRRGIKTLERAKSLEFRHHSTAAQSPIDIEIVPSEGIAELTTALMPTVKYCSEAILADGTSRPEMVLQLGAEANEQKNMYYSQVDIVWATKIEGRDWAKRENGFARESMKMFNLFVSHYRCIAADVMANHVHQDLPTQRFWVREVNPNEKISTHDDIESYITDFAKFRGKPDDPEHPVVTLSVGSSLHPRAERAEVVRALSEVLTNGPRIPLHWDTLITGLQEYMHRGNYSTAIIICGLALELRLRNIIYGVLVNKGISEAEAEDSCESKYPGPIKKLDYLNKELRHAGIPTVSEPKIDMWKNMMYKVRKKVVHEGYAPTEQEVKEAIRATCEMLDDLERIAQGHDYFLQDIGAAICSIYSI